MMFEKVILVDYDGVCGDWTHAFNMWATFTKNMKVINPRAYHISERMKISTEEAQSLLHEFNTSSFIEKIPPYKDAIKYIRKLHEEHGYVFHCITAVPKMGSVQKHRWSNAEMLFGLTVFERIVHVGEIGDKRAALSDYANSNCWWIDDVPANVKVGNDLYLRGVLMKHSYNEMHHTLLRSVWNWKEFYDMIIEERSSV